MIAVLCLSVADPLSYVYIMKQKVAYKVLLCLFYTICCTQLTAQNCSPCNTLITGADNLSYTVSGGQTLCLDTLAEFTGTIILNGGVVCNRGVFNPQFIALTSGTLVNQALMVFTPTLSIGLGAVLFNQATGSAAIGDDVDISSGSLLNDGILDLKENLLFNSGQLINNGVINCRQLSGSAVSLIVNSSIINTD